MKLSTKRNTPLTRFPGTYDILRPFILLQHTRPSGSCHYDMLLETSYGTNLENKSLKALLCKNKPSLDDDAIIWETHGIHRRKWLTLPENGFECSNGIFLPVDKGNFIVSKRNNLIYIQINSNCFVGKYMMEIYVNRGYHHRWTKIK